MKLEYVLGVEFSELTHELAMRGESGIALRILAKKSSPPFYT